MPENPNPQGKGLVPVLAQLSSVRAAAQHVPAKHIEQISNELFTSLFVLESEFKFKAVAGRSYWLYRKNGRFWLSPIGPHEWGPEQYGQYIGECMLHEDITWTLELSEEASEDQELIQYLQDKKDAFEKQLEEAEAVEDILPGHRKDFGFYRRAYAFALAHSLGVSMEKSGIKQMTYEQAQGVLPDHSASEADSEEKAG